jgi:transcriptional regulator with XRE-family HTH domain
MTRFGECLRSIRYVNNESIHDMSRRLGKPVEWIALIEHGRLPIPGGFPDKLAKAYGLSEPTRWVVSMAARCSKTKIDSWHDPIGRDG